MIPWRFEFGVWSIVSYPSPQGFYQNFADVSNGRMIHHDPSYLWEAAVNSDPGFRISVFLSSGHVCALWSIAEQPSLHICKWQIVKLTAFSHVEQMRACCTDTKFRWHEERTPGSSCKDLDFENGPIQWSHGESFSPLEDHLHLLWPRPLPMNPMTCTSIQLPLAFCRPAWSSAAQARW